MHVVTNLSLHIDGDTATDARIETWFAMFEGSLRKLMEDDALAIEFDRRAFNFVFRRHGHAFDLNTLADGHTAVLTVLAELLIRQEDDRSRGTVGAQLAIRPKRVACRGGCQAERSGRKI